MGRAPYYLPQNYKKRINWTNKAGIAKTGQVSKKGWVKTGEHWDGSQDETVAVTPIHFNLLDWMKKRGMKWENHLGLAIPVDAPTEIKELLLPKGYSPKD
jgi:hypothetical protein